jgi:hypothetical protein
MAEFSKHKDIEALAQKAAQDLKGIENEYQKYLKEGTIPESLLVEVRNCIGNLRSALDFLWCKIPGAGSNNYFPMANSPADFVNKTKGVDQKYLTVVEKYQPYKELIWIGNFNLLRNKNFHLTLVPQTRKETKEFSVKSKDGSSSVRMIGTKFVGDGTVNISVDGVLVPIDMKTEFPADVPGVNIERKIWIDFIFNGSSISPDFPGDISVLPFLKQSFSNTVKILSEIESVQ